jgi:hypothetical protein
VQGLRQALLTQYLDFFDVCRNAWSLHVLLVCGQLLLLVTLLRFNIVWSAPQASARAHVTLDSYRTDITSFPNTTLRYFPQVKQCGLGWMQEYMQLHADVMQGKLPQRHFLSVAVEAGLADRLTGLITQFWHAVLTRRAFSTATYGTLPGWEAVCQSPFVNWTLPAPGVPPEAIEPLKYTYKGVRGYSGDQRTLPSELPASKYQILYGTNMNAKMALYRNSNLSALFQPDPEYILGASNRGRTFELAHNPYHMQQLWDFGVSPTTTFMCGFFVLCSPADAIVAYYSKFWDQLVELGVLKIGLQVRTGDGVFTAGESDDAVSAAALARSATWFECAQKIEEKFAAPGQRVLWFLNSDSKQLRKAAKAKYGAKLVTDDELAMTHPDCFQAKDKQSCQQATMDVAYQHSLGSMMTFSMVDYHVITKASGFGRLGAWMSGR